jgi:hypothetical protein
MGLPSIHNLKLGTGNLSKGDKFMQNTDRFTKIILVIIAIGIFGLLLKPLFHISPAEAQSSKQYVAIGYKNYFIDDVSKAEVVIGGFETGGPMVPLLETVNRKGWKLHSIVAGNQGWVVIAEK